MANHIYQRYSQYLVDEDYAADDSDRSPVAKDRDRIIHCGAFRRLQRKSQIVGVQSFDFFRTRLTHTLECAQVGRGIAKRIVDATTVDLTGIVEERSDFVDLIEAACLAHDLGHPPFGHNGERALSKKVDEHSGGLFEGNAQSVRIATRLEPKTIVNNERCGLDLTATTLRAIVKYRETESEAKAAGKKKFCFYDDEEDKQLREWLLDGDGADNDLAVRILNAADDIAYACHDFEDGVWSGMIPLSRLIDERDEAARSVVWAYLEREEPELFAGTTFETVITTLLKGQVDEDWVRVPFDRRFNAKADLKNFTAGLIGALIETLTLDGGFPESDADFPTEAKQLIVFMQTLATVFMITSPALETVRYGQRRLVERLFEAYWENPAMLPQRDAWSELEKNNPGRLKDKVWREKCVLVRDHIAGMTDLFALHTHGEMFGAGAAPNLRAF